MESRDFVMIDTQNVTNPLKLQIISFLIQRYDWYPKRYESSEITNYLIFDPAYVSLR